MNFTAHSDTVVSPGKEQCVVLLNHCQAGIGIKIVGGKTDSGPNYGIFVKKAIPGSPAARNNTLREGDKILKVNKENMTHVSNERAMSVLLKASKAGLVSFLIDRSETAQREYLELMGTLNNGSILDKYTNIKKTSTQNTVNGKVPPSRQATGQKRSWGLTGGRMSPLSSGSMSPRDMLSNGHLESGVVLDAKLAYGDARPISVAESNGDSGLHTSSSTLNNMSQLTVTNVTLSNGLGMSITGGINHDDGPGIMVKEIINGGDIYYDGQIKQGDQIISINGESFLNVTHEEAKMKLTQIKLRTDKEFEITFTSQKNLSEGTENSFGQQDRLLKERSPPETSLKVAEVGCNLDNGQSKTPSLDKKGNKSSPPKRFSPTNGFSSIMQSSILPSSIPFYLQQDLAVPQPGSTTQQDRNNNHSKPSSLLKRRLSLAPASKLRVEKLEVALSYLGIHLMSAQQEDIRSKLNVDAAGLVSYGQFVEVAQDVLGDNLLDRSQALSQSRLRFAVHDIEKNGLDDQVPPPRNDPEVDKPVRVTRIDDSEIEELKRQRDNAVKEVRRLQNILEEKQYSHFAGVEHLESLKRTAEDALEESLALKNQVYFATQAKIDAERKDHEYEEVIKMLEEEVHLLKTKGTPKQQEFQELQKKVVVLGCQLRKVEVIKRTYEVATERLLNFADRVHSNLRKGALSSPTTPPNPISLQQGSGSNQQPPTYLSPKQVSQKLADEARDVVRGVRTLLEEEPLPFGWEEAYTAGGERYFINHVTQFTTWLHPISHVKKE